MHAAPLSRRLIILLLCAGIAAMFAGSFAHRLSNPSLIKSVASRQAGQASSTPQQGMGKNMDPHVMEKVSDLMSALKANPNDFSTRMALAEVFMEAQDPSSAILHLQKATEIRPESHEAHYILGVLRYELDLFEESAQSFERALKLEEDPGTMFNLGIIYHEHLNRGEEALALFQRVAASAKAPQELRDRAKAMAREQK